MDILSALGTSSGLSFTSGINAYFPLLIAAMAANPKVQAWLHLHANTNQNLSFLSQDWVIAALIVLIILDFLSDKIPGMSGFWNGVHTIIRPLTGALASGTVAPSDHPQWLIVFLVLGASLAMMSHTTKIVTRTAASAATVGCATPILSVLEDVAVVVGVIVAFVAPYLMLFLALALVILFIWFAPRLLSELRYYWRMTSSFLAWIVNIGIARKPEERPTDVFRKLSATDRTHLYQVVPNSAVIRAGVQLVWRKQRGGTRRDEWHGALSVWLLFTDETLILFPPSQPHKTCIIPFVEVQMLKLKKSVSEGILTVRLQTGQEYTCTALRSSLSAAIKTASILYTHYHLPSGKPFQGTQMYAYPVRGAP